MATTTSTPERVMYDYVQAYEKLYNRHPRDLRVLDNDWLVVNGARMRVSELEMLTNQLQTEYKQTTNQQQRRIVSRLIKWLKG